MITVMVVDDHFLVRAALVALLEDTADLTVAAVATNGDEAVRLAQLVRPDVVLMDLSMPGRDGVTATRIILERLPATRIVLLTLSQDRRRVDQALALGAVDYLVKGCEPEVVLEAVRQAACGVGV